MWKKIAAEKKCRKFFTGFQYDAGLQMAMAAAQATFDQFKKAHKNPRRRQEYFSVNLLFVGNGKVEMVWLESIRFGEGGIFGVPCRDAALDRGIKQDVELKFNISSICDWMYVDNGKLVGGETVRHVVKSLSDEELVRWEMLVPFIILDKNDFNLPINLLLNCIGYDDLSSVLKYINRDKNLLNMIGIVGRYFGSAGAGKILLKPVNYCADVGGKNVMSALLDAGADPNWGDEVGKTALMAAAGRGDRDITRLLIDWKARINVANELGFTSLFYAVQSDQADCVRMLLMNGADVKHVTVYGEGVLHYANSPTIANLLIHAGAVIDVKEKTLNQSPLATAIERGNISVAVELILAGCKINKSDLKLARERLESAQWHLFESAVLKMR